MPAKQIRLGNKRLGPHKAVIRPDFRSKTVLVTDTWEYVKMWLRRRGHAKALVYWEQAAEFHAATLRLQNTSAPLTAYYCFLNAAKTLLAIRGMSFSDHHGVSGRTDSERASLSAEVVTFKSSGVLAALCRYFDEPAKSDEHTLKDLLYNLPVIHRAYNLTYSSRPELFTPVVSPKYVKKEQSAKAWFSTEITDRRYANQHTVKKLPGGYEQDKSPDLLDDEKFVIRRRNRFDWLRGPGEHDGNLKRLTKYHRAVRRNVFYIQGPSRLWYLKRRSDRKGMIDRSTVTITYAAMHRLSELARYNPMLLAKHFDSQHNWLLCEFIKTAVVQFIDELSSEITGQDFMLPGLRG